MSNENTSIIVGLDIGTTKIAAIIGQKTEHGKIEILGIGKTKSLGVHRGVVANIEQTIISIKQALELASNHAQVDIAEVVVGIAGQHIKSMQHHGLITRSSYDEEVSQDDLNRLVESMHLIPMPPGEEIIHVIPQDYTVDNESGIRNPVGHSGIRLEGNFHIISGQAGAIRNIVKCVNRAGYSISSLNLEPLASSESVLSDEEKEAGVVLVDIGGGTTDIAVFYDGIIRHTAVIPFGGNIISDDIKENCGLIKTQAEELKIKYGSAIAMENTKNDVISITRIKGLPPKEITVNYLSQIIQARMEEIIEFVAYEIKNSGFEKKLSAGIVITGGGACLKHIHSLFTLKTGMDCRVGTPNEHIVSASDELKNPMYATGIGLMLLGAVDLDQKCLKNKKQIVQDVHKTERTTAESAPVNEKTSKPVKPKIGDFFGSLIGKTKDLFNDEGIQ